MSKNELMAIKAALNCASDIIQHLCTEDYPETDFGDKEIKEMFYELNSMVLKIYAKIKAETV